MGKGRVREFKIRLIDIEGRKVECLTRLFMYSSIQRWKWSNGEVTNIVVAL